MSHSRPHKRGKPRRKTTETINISIPIDGYMREKTILAVYPVSRSEWWAGVKEGRYPKPVKLGPRITAWRASDIRTLIDRIDEGAA